MSTEPAIRAVSVGKRYWSGGTQVIVFQDLDLQVRPGERLGIVGASGAGKSTLLHLLGGLEQPSSGSIFHGDREITRLPEPARADFRNRELAFVWQRSSLLPDFSALENVMMPLLIRGAKAESAASLAAARLAEVGLAARQHHRPSELSGGEQQRVALARALAAQPKVLLADEPTGNLDGTTGEAIIQLLTEMLETHRLTSVFVTHSEALAARCDRVLELNGGSLQPLQKAAWAGIGLRQDAARLGGGTYV